MIRNFHKRKTQFWAAHYLKYLDIKMHMQSYKPKSENIANKRKEKKKFYNYHLHKL